MARWHKALRFHVPLIEPDVRISRIRLSEKVHAFAFGTRLGSHFNSTKPKRCSSQRLQCQRACDNGSLLMHNQ
jgi:hypothetical protein